MVLVEKNLPVNAGDMRCGFDPWNGKIPWLRRGDRRPHEPGNSRGGQPRRLRPGGDETHAGKPMPKHLSHQFSSVVQPCKTLHDPMDSSTPGFPVHQQLLKHAQAHVHRVGDAIQSFHPLWSPSSSAFSLSQHQGLF